MPQESIKLDVSGISDLVKNLESFPKEVYEEVQNEIDKAAQKILERAKQLTPVKTGYLKNHFSISIQGDISRKILSAQLINNSPHAHLVEFGHVMTTNNKGRGKGKFIKVVDGKPFIRPALEAASTEVINDLVQGVNTALEKMESKAK